MRKKEILHLYFESEKRKLKSQKVEVTVRGWGVGQMGGRWLKRYKLSAIRALRSDDLM